MSPSKDSTNKEKAKESHAMKVKDTLNDKHEKQSDVKEATPNVDVGASIGEVLSSELEKTDLGHLINEYKNVVIALVVLFVVSALGYTGWKAKQSNDNEEARSLIVEFKKNNLDKVDSKNADSEKLYVNYQELVSKVKNGNLLLELSPQILDILRTKDAFKGNDWVSVFKKAQSLCSKGEFCYNHFTLILATIFEEQGIIAEALKEYEGLIGNEYVVEDRLYFELTRLSAKLNLVEKKKKYMDFLRKNHVASEYKILAEQL